MPDQKDPTDMTEVLEDISVSPMGLSDLEFQDDVPTEVETPEDTIRRLENSLSEAVGAANLNYEALVLLMNICKEKGFEPFPNESLPIGKPVKDMTQEELLARNSVIARRVEMTRAKNPDKLRMPTEEEMDAIRATSIHEPENPAMGALLQALMRGEKEVSICALQERVAALEERQRERAQ